MSTKIYYAYRMPVKVFSTTFLPAFRKHVFKKATAWTRKHLLGEPTVEALRAFYITMADASLSKLRSHVCFDCSFNAWIHKNKVYVILYGESFLWEAFKLPEEVEDYRYWNNTDQPEGITRRQWNQRDKTWEKVCLSEATGWDTGRLVHEIINASTKQGLIEIGTSILGVDGAWGAITFHLNPKTRKHEA